jgi:2-dehydropantoate 2-reductase
MARILVAGAGALGSVFGGFLKLAGHDVTLLGRSWHLDAIGARGLQIDGLWGEHVARGFARAADPAAVDGVFEAILVTVKSFDTGAMAGAVAAHVADDGVMISLQNGLGNVEAVVERVGADRTIGGRVIFGSEIVEPGHVRITVFAEPVLLGAWPQDAMGEGTTYSPSAQERARVWAERFRRAGVPTQYSDDVHAALWGKVLYNAALNPLGALLGVHYGALMENPDTRAVMDRVIDEAYAVACAEGVLLPWSSAAQYREVFYGRLVPATYHHRSSMLQDLERGRPTEIDAINGAVWKRAETHGMVAAANELLTRLVHARSAAPRVPGDGRSHQQS